MSGTGPSQLQYGDFQTAFCCLEQLVFLLDGAMILLNDHRDGDVTTSVNLLSEPQAALDREIEAYIREHGDDLRCLHLLCPRCDRVFDRSTPRRVCPSCVPEVGLERQELSDEQVRERASFDLCASRTALLVNILRRVAEQLSPQLPRSDATVPFSDVLNHARQIVEGYVDHLVFYTRHFGDILRLDDRRNLLPSGTTLEEKYRDYLRTRDKLHAAYNWLRSCVREHPDFAETGETPTAPRIFHQPVMISSSANRVTDHSPDFTSVNWFGTRYTFTPGNQAEAVRVLWEAYERGHRLSQARICKEIEAAGDNFKLSKVFRRRKEPKGYEQHPAWKTMIQADGDGCFRLVPPVG